jgi:hypothetical protein
MTTSGSRRSLVTCAAFASLLSAAGNGFIYLVCYITGIIPWNMLSPGRGVSLTPKLVTLVSIGGALGGTAIYAILKRYSSNPVGRFRMYAGLVLVLSFGAPLLIDTFTTPLVIALDLMHVVVYVSTVYALTVWPEPGRITATA